MKALAELKFLINHSISSGGVTMGYVHLSIDHLQTWQERTSNRLVALFVLDEVVKQWLPKNSDEAARPADAA